MGKNAKNRLKIKEKAEILVQENFQKQGNQLKRGTLTPLYFHLFTFHFKNPRVLSMVTIMYISLMLQGTPYNFYTPCIITLIFAYLASMECKLSNDV